MSRDDGHYARFYYQRFIREFPEVYADDAAFSTWMRLLVRAESVWPMTAELPRSVRPRALRTLVEAGLVATDGTSYEVRGLTAERTRRRDAGRKGAAVRWDSDRNANASPKAPANAMPSTSKSKAEAKIPPPPAERGRRKDGTNPRSRGTAPRQTGASLRDQGASPRQERKAQKRDMTPIHVILARASGAGHEDPAA